jgi:hypothetical protein
VAQKSSVEMGYRSNLRMVPDPSTAPARRVTNISSSSAGRTLSLLGVFDTQPASSSVVERSGKLLSLMTKGKKGMAKERPHPHYGVKPKSENLDYGTLPRLENLDYGVKPRLESLDYGTLPKLLLTSTLSLCHKHVQGARFVLSRSRDWWLLLWRRYVRT